MNDKYVQSIIKSINILELFKDKELLGISDITNYLGYPTSTVYRIVSTLEYTGYLRQEPITNKY